MLRGFGPYFVPSPTAMPPMCDPREFLRAPYHSKCGECHGDSKYELKLCNCCHPKIIVSPNEAVCRHSVTSPPWEDAGGLRWQGLCSHVDSSPHQAGASGWQGLCSYGSTSLRRALWHSCWKKSARVRYPTMRCTLSQGRRLSLVVRDQRDSPARARNPHPTPTARGLTGL